MKFVIEKVKIMLTVEVMSLLVLKYFCSLSSLIKAKWAKHTQREVILSLLCNAINN